MPWTEIMGSELNVEALSAVSRRHVLRPEFVAEEYWPEDVDDDCADDPVEDDDWEDAIGTIIERRHDRDASSRATIRTQA
jgi:hypothetical protein